MTNNTNVFARAAAPLSVLVAVFGGLFIAAPAHASIGYGAQPVYTVGSQVCDGRYDPNCLIKQNNYLVTSSLNYEPYQNTYNYNTRYVPVPYVYNNPPASYYTPLTNNIVVPISYSYSYSYVQPSSSYITYPSYYSYGYNTPSYYYDANSYNNTSYASNSYDDCEYSYDCDY